MLLLDSVACAGARAAVVSAIFMQRHKHRSILTPLRVGLPGQPVAVEPSPPSAPPALEPVEVLLIEDNPADVLLFEDALKDSERQVVVHHVNDAEKALLLLSDRRFEPDLIILDLNLPRFS